MGPTVHPGATPYWPRVRIFFSRRASQEVSSKHPVTAEYEVIFSFSFHSFPLPPSPPPHTPNLHGEIVRGVSAACLWRKVDTRVGELGKVQRFLCALGLARPSPKPAVPAGRFNVVCGTLRKIENRNGNKMEVVVCGLADAVVQFSNQSTTRRPMD